MSSAKSTPGMLETIAELMSQGVRLPIAELGMGGYERSKSGRGSNGNAVSQDIVKKRERLAKAKRRISNDSRKVNQAKARLK